MITRKPLRVVRLAVMTAVMVVGMQLVAMAPAGSDTGDVIQFSSATYTVSETGGVQTVLTLDCTGVCPAAPPQDFVTVTTTSGTAVSGTDFTDLAGGQDSALGSATDYHDPILDDGDSDEGCPQTFTETLSSPTNGATLGAITTATVTITEDPASPCVTDTDLGLTGVPANIGVNAPTSAGAVVTYTNPTATDESGDSPVATVNCAPASGSTFPIGVTTVTCTATDADDTPTTATASFTVTVGAPTGGGGGGGTGSGLSLSASPASGPPGTKISVFSLNPCPTGATSATIFLQGASGAIASAPATSFGAPGWSGTLTVPNGTPSAFDTITAVCFQGSAPVAAYTPVSFAVSGPGAHHHHNHHHNHHHHHHHH